MKTFEIDNNTSFDDIIFMDLIESTSPRHDEEKAKAYGLDHWKNLNDKSKKLWDYIYGRENRLKGWMTRDISEPKWMERAFDKMELERDGVIL